MAFSKKTWKDRQSEYPNRRTLTPTGTQNEYEVARSEGVVIEEGDKLDAKALNDLESRVATAVQEAQITANTAKSQSIALYTHSNSTLTGSGENGKFKATASGTYTAFNIGGVSYAVKCGEESEIELVSGAWYSFILDTEAKTVNFKQGGAGLNFKIVGGTTQPSSPKENTIWINTSTAIGEWQFSATQPTKRADGTALQSGDVWIIVGFLSKVAFNPMKKNSIMLYPVSVKQYIGNKWVSKDVFCYQKDKWNAFDMIILDANGLYTDNTGAFSMKYQGGNSGSGSVTPSNNTIGMYVSNSSDSNGTRYTVCCHETAIDVTGYNTLKVSYSGISGYSNENQCLYVGLASVNNNTSFLVSASTGSRTAGTLTVDISNIKQKAYIKIMLTSYWYGAYSTSITGISLY